MKTESLKHKTRIPEFFLKLNTLGKVRKQYKELFKGKENILTYKEFGGLSLGSLEAFNQLIFPFLMISCHLVKKEDVKKLFQEFFDRQEKPNSSFSLTDLTFEFITNVLDKQLPSIGQSNLQSLCKYWNSTCSEVDPNSEIKKADINGHIMMADDGSLLVINGKGERKDNDYHKIAVLVDFGDTKRMIDVIPGGYDIPDINNNIINVVSTELRLPSQYVKDQVDIGKKDIVNPNIAVLSNSNQDGKLIHIAFNGQSGKDMRLTGRGFFPTTLGDYFFSLLLLSKDLHINEYYFRGKKLSDGEINIFKKIEIPQSVFAFFSKFKVGTGYELTDILKSATKYS